MKLHSSSTSQYQPVTGYFAGGVEINAVPFDYSLTVMPEPAPRPWPVASFDDLTAAHFEAIAADASIISTTRIGPIRRVFRRSTDVTDYTDSFQRAAPSASSARDRTFLLAPRSVCEICAICGCLTSGSMDRRFYVR